MRNRMFPRATTALAVLAPFALLACSGSTDTVLPGAEAAASGLAAPAAGSDGSAGGAAAVGIAASGTAAAAAGRAGGLRVVRFPAEDPGPPLYARVTPLLNQIFVADGMVAIPFYRDPACVPLDADLLAHMHPPGEHGPGAFACALLVEGSYTIEHDAPQGTFPVRVVASGPAQFWFVPWSDFEAATTDGTLTMAELIALAPLRGTASSFNEMLAPRLDDHHVVITSRGTLPDGRTFQFNVNHRGDVTQSIHLQLR
jgi:hypothetical protein